jgi:hypothetical protein
MRSGHKILVAAALVALSALPASAASYINSTVAIADPSTPANVLKPNANGSINTQGAIAPTQSAPTVTAASVGPSSAQAKAAGAFNYYFIQNVSASASIACQWAGTAALNSGGSFMLPPYASRTWENNAVPNAALNCIASAAATPATIETQ